MFKGESLARAAPYRVGQRQAQDRPVLGGNPDCTGGEVDRHAK